MLELSESEEARALELHRDSAVVDLHSDVPLMDISIRRFAGEREVMHNLVVPRMKRGGVDLAVSVVMADGGRLYPWGYDRFKVEYHGAAREALEVLDGMFAEEEESDDVWILARTFADIERAVSEDKVALLLSLEGGRALEGSLALLRTYHRLGLRVITLTHNARNQLGDGWGERGTGGGLTSFGREVVAEMNRLGMTIDLAHSSESTFRDAIRHSRAPVICSHTLVKPVTKSYGLTRDQLRAIGDNGGLVGVMFVVGSTEELGKATVMNIVNQIEYVAETIGIAHVGLGPDFMDYIKPLNMPIEIGQWRETGLDFNDYCDFPGYQILFPPEIDNVSLMPNITRAMVARGFTGDDIRKVLGANALRVFKEVMQ